MVGRLQTLAAAACAGALLAACPATRPAAADERPADAAQAAGAEGHAVVTLTTPAGASHRVRAELALTPEAQARGLMWRESLPSGTGMLFVFPREKIQSFWMKNTLIPLDMMFISSDGEVVGIVHEAEPLTETSRRVGRPSRYVLEVAGGWCRANGVEPGTRASFDGPLAPVQPARTPEAAAPPTR